MAGQVPRTPSCALRRLGGAFFGAELLATRKRFCPAIVDYVPENASVDDLQRLVQVQSQISLAAAYGSSASVLAPSRFLLLVVIASNLLAMAST